MSETLTDVDTFTATIQMPTSGENVSAADLRDKAIQRLANRTYNNKLRLDAHDTDVTNLEAADTSLDGRLDFIEGSRGAFVSNSTGIASNLSNISAVTELRVRATRMYDTWTGSVYAVITNSATGTKSFRVSLSGASGLDVLADQQDAAGVGAVSFSDIVQVNGISGAEQILLTWTNSETAGDNTLRAVFTYSH
jgi:hypothetical protein